MAIMYNLFLVQTPFQLFNAVEAKNRFHLNQKNILIIIHKGNQKNLDQIKKILENVIDRVAQHSRNEISDSDCTSVWQTKTGEQITFHFTYRAFKISSSPNFHISVLFTVNQIERINGLNAVIEQDLITESMAMKALVQRLPGIVQTQSAILIQGEPYTGKSTLVKFLLASSELLGWKQAFSLEEIQLKLQENEEGAFCIILE
ncbi:MAG: hypothetical protein IE880_08395, partial [Epsilonproteobacteria bacterium]|nr:hypothetical protein [Campylobacterota bacterium]